jgi:hypothetical protein
MATASLPRITPASQDNSLQARIAASNSRNAVSFSSAQTTERVALSGCASAIQIVRPSKSTADTQPKLHPALLRLSAMISSYFTGSATPLIVQNR